MGDGEYLAPNRSWISQHVIYVRSKGDTTMKRSAKGSKMSDQYSIFACCEETLYASFLLLP